MKPVCLLKPVYQAGPQALRWKGGQHTEIKVHGVTPVGEVELAQCSASLETEGLRQETRLGECIQSTYQDVIVLSLTYAQSGLTGDAPQFSLGDQFNAPATPVAAAPVC